MKGQKKLIKIAKDLFKKSLHLGVVNEMQTQQVLKEFTGEKPAHLVSILKIYKALIQRALSQEEIVVETATPIINKTDIEKALLAKTKAQKVSFKTNPKIVLGTKITHGDWIWDATLEAKLKQLTINN